MDADTTPKPPWLDILELAQRAPSPHNVQPWKVAIVSDTECRVYVDPARILPQEDTTGSFITSGMVMYLETMRYSAQNFGYELTYTISETYQPNQTNLQEFARVRLQPTTKPAEYNRDVIASRRTSRLGQTKQDVPAAAQEALQRTARHYGAEYGFTAQPVLIEQMLALNVHALFQDLNTPSYHDEIVSWFRFGRRDSRMHKDGLDNRCMQIPLGEYYTSAKMPFILRAPGIRKLFARHYRKLLGPTYTLGWISGTFWDTADEVTAGKLLTAFWLELTRQGLYIHPFGNLVTNLPARREFEAAMAARDVWFVFRIGYTPEPPESYRHSVSQILIGVQK
jgi:nitroreductase